MISILVRGTPAEHPTASLTEARRTYGTAYEGWTRLIRRSAIHQLGTRNTALAGLLVLCIRIHTRDWENIQASAVGQAVIDALAGIAYESPAQVSKLFIDKRPPRVDTSGAWPANEGALISIWPAAEIEEAFLEAIAALTERLTEETGETGPADSPEDSV